MIKKVLVGLLVVGLLISFFMPATPVQAADAQLYEGYSADDDEAVELYSNIWGAQTFTTGTTAHSIIAVRLLLYREGSPGDVTVSIRATTGSDPSGVDLTTGTLNGDDFTDNAAGVWYEFDLSLEACYIEASTMYAIIVRTTAGNAANSIHWRSDGSAGAEPNGQEETSANSGATWTGDADDDFMFEIWGEPIIEVLGAQVFSGYLETGDWLIVATYKNYYVPYYPTQSCPANFYMRLLDDTTMIAQTNCPAWGYRPASFYFSKALADSKEWGVTDYKIRLYGDFTGTPYADYTILAADWRGADLAFLDAWVIQEANIIGEDIGVTLTTTIADKGEILNAFGRAIFLRGIPSLDEVRPDLFEYVLQQTEYEENIYTGALQEATEWETKVGTTVATMLTNGGMLLGITGQQVGMMIIVIIMLALIAVLAMKGHLTIGIMLTFVPMLLGAWLGFISYIIAGVIVIILGGGMFAYKLWLGR